MPFALLALAADPLGGLERFAVGLIVFELASGLLLAGILIANIRRLVHGRPDVGLGSVGVGAGVLELSVFYIFRGGGGRIATVTLVVGIASLLTGLLNMVRGARPPHRDPSSRGSSQLPHDADEGGGPSHVTSQRNRVRQPAPRHRAISRGLAAIP